MTDIVERLRNWLNQGQREQHENALKAADEIELLREENERLRADTEQERLLGFEGGVCSVHDQALHEGRDDIATWIANRYPTATKSISALPTNHNAPGQADADPSQCPRPENK